MNTYRYRIRIADAVWEYSLPVKVEMDDIIRPFVIETEKPTFYIDYQIGHPLDTDEVLINPSVPTVWMGPDYYRVERLSSMSLKAQSCYILHYNDPYHMEGFIYPGKEKLFKNMEKIIDVSDMELQLTAINAISLHSSFINYRGKAILFSGPSGTGKSTQAMLWEKWRGARQINGDRTVIRNVDGIWLACGSPFSGSSGVCKNESVPIRTVVVLRQAADNSVRQLNSGEAFRFLYSETAIPTWNKWAHTSIMNIIDQIVNELSVVMLSCRPDKSAVDCLDQYLLDVQNDC